MRVLNVTFQQNEMEFKSVIMNSTGHTYCLGAARFLGNDCAGGLKLLIIGTKNEMVQIQGGKRCLELWRRKTLVSNPSLLHLG